MATKRLSTYSVRLNPGVKNHTWLASLRLNCEDNFILNIIFGTGALPENSYSNPSAADAYVDISLFPYYLDLVRNEGPVNVRFPNENEPAGFVVYSLNEPVGDGE